jgi:hypothetical protein
LVYAELRREFLEQDRDRQLHRSMLPYPREMRVIERSTERRSRRLQQLPKDVGSEWLRLIFCDALDGAAAAGGSLIVTRDVAISSNHHRRESSAAG